MLMNMREYMIVYNLNYMDKKPGQGCCKWSVISFIYNNLGLVLFCKNANTLTLKELRFV